MKKLIFGIIFLFCVNSYAINGFSIYKMYTQYDTVTHTNLDSNLNRPASWSSLLVDTLDRKFIRFSDLTNGDTTLSSIKVDTIRSNPYIDSTKGNTVHTGTYTVSSTVSVDSLKSTKGINATGGTFSGRVTGSDIQLSDSVKAVYGDFSGVLEVDSLKSIKGINATGGTFSGRITGSDIDVSDTVKGGNADFTGRVTATDLSVSDSVIASTIFSGNTIKANGWISGHNIVANDRVSGVTGSFDSTRTRVSVFDSIKLGTGSYLKTYVEGSFPCTLKTSDVTVQQIGTAYYTKIGNVFTVSIPRILGTSNSDRLRLYCRFPYKPKLTDDFSGVDTRPVIVRNDGPAQGMVEAPDYAGFIAFRVGVSLTGFATSVEKGIYAPFTISYITE